MKNFLKSLFIISLFTTIVLPSHADNVTAEDVLIIYDQEYENLKLDEDYVDDGCEVTKNGSDRLFSCKIKTSEDSLEKVYSFSLSAENTSIKFNGDYKIDGEIINVKENEEIESIFGLMLFNNYLDFIKVVGTTKGYSETEIIDFIKSMFLETSDLQEDVKTEELKKSGIYIDDDAMTIEIKIDQFNILKPINKPNDNEEEQKNENVTIANDSKSNPKTFSGSSHILIGGLSVFFVGMIVILKKKTMFENI